MASRPRRDHKVMPLLRSARDRAVASLAVAACVLLLTACVAACSVSTASSTPAATAPVATRGLTDGGAATELGSAAPASTNPAARPAASASSQTVTTSAAPASAPKTSAAVASVPAAGVAAASAATASVVAASAAATSEVGASASAASVPAASTSPQAAATAPAILWGTLDTATNTAATEARGGVKMAMLELNWSSFEPSNGQVSASYVASAKAELAAFRAAGMKVTLGLGMHYTPGWVLNLADGKYVDQRGDTASEANFVFSAAVRQAAATYMTLVSRSLPLSDFWAIRLTSGGDEEMLYPSGGDYWAFDNAALTGSGLAAGMTPNPDPAWRPGQSGLTQSQIQDWVSWYIGGLVNVTTWQMSVLGSLGFSGNYETVTPGAGTHPDALVDTEARNLSNDGITGEGAVWNLYYAGLKGKANVIAYVSSVADMSGNNEGCATGDEAVPLNSAAVDSWSATRWISRIASADGLRVGGENPGFGASAASDAQYTNTGSDGMMAVAIGQARSCHFTAFYWAHDVHLWDGTVPFSLYQSLIAG